MLSTEEMEILSNKFDEVLKIFSIENKITDLQALCLFQANFIRILIDLDVDEKTLDIILNFVKNHVKQ